MGCPIGQNSLFGTGTNYIKFQGGDLIAIESANTVERQMLSDLKFNYKQLLRGRVILKPGQVNYLMNHLGLGDNATFVSIVARYDTKSKIEEDNYVNWSFYDDLTKIHSMCQYMCLTGNSTNRVKQLYLTNPNSNYPVTLDVMVAVLDDSYNFFTDITNQSGTSFVNLRYTDFKSYVIGESIKVLDSQGRALVYIVLNNINSIEITGNILIIDDNALGRLFFQFVSESDTRQVNSILNYVLDNPNVDIETLPFDNQAPTLYWYSNVGNLGTSSFISLAGQIDGVPYNTNDGPTFSTTISLLQFGGVSQILSKQQIINLLIDKVVDNRDGTMSLASGDIILTGTQGQVNEVNGPGNYKMTLLINDIAGNDLSNTEMYLNVINRDVIPPVVYWKERVNNQFDQPYITFMGATSGAPYNSLIGKTFSTTIVFPTYQEGGEITKQKLIDITIDKIIDEIDGELPINDFHIILTDSQGNEAFTIYDLGNYSMTFNITDISENSLYGTYLNLSVVSQLPDIAPPVIYWFTTVGDIPTELPILCDGKDVGEAPFNSTDGISFNTTLSFGSYSTQSIITKMDLNNLLIDYVYDDRDGPITLTESNINLAQSDGFNTYTLEFIEAPGIYSMTFNLSDNSNNGILNLTMYLDITE